MPRVSAIVATLNSQKTLNICLNSLRQYYLEGYIGEIIVVDGGSVDRTLEIAREYPTKIIRQSKSLWSSNPSAGRYRAYQDGLELSKEDFILNIDSDAYLGPGFFPTGIEFFEDELLGVLGCSPRAANSGILGAALGERGDFHKLQIRRCQSKQNSSSLYLQFATGYPYIQVTGPCYIARRKMLTEAGGYFGSVDELELNERTRKAGFKVLWWTESPVYNYYRGSFLELYRERRHEAIACAKVWSRSTQVFSFLLLNPIARLVFAVALSIRYLNPAHTAVGLVEGLGLYAGLPKGLSNPR
ncbi:MAG: glycosyltransferase family 2 protein [Nitrososphaerota archaeon]|nr:glycosyltransferase family 2 protein [Nitrososphaerota archaeon]